VTSLREDFADAADKYRRELLAHCYRMLGSVDEAEDLVQETYLRAWRAYGSFAGRASVRSWLYRIATNACLNALEHRNRRPLPSGLGAPLTDPFGATRAAEPDVPWLEPIPDAMVTPESADPAAVVALRDSLRLALMASLQYLPPKQRAVLILREVLGFPAADVAEMLDTSVAAVKSALQRARATLDAADLSDSADLLEPTSAEARRLLEQYVAAFERADVTILEKALRTDAALELVPTRTWFAGKATCVPYLGSVIGSPGDWRMVPTLANGQPAVATYYRGQGFGVAVLTVHHDGIGRITVFGRPNLMRRFDVS
jgi:RNA polymerase sigma-70 factor, ECF subfamily